MKPPIRLAEPADIYRGDQLLQQIATTLGVPVDALFAEPSELVFYADAEGTRWSLVGDASDSLTVRRISGQSPEHIHSDETVACFLVGNLETTQGKVLATLINQVLMAHIPLARRD